MILALAGLFVFVLSSDGDGDGRAATSASWSHCRVKGLQRASGLAVYGDELLVVAGGGDRNIYAIQRRGLQHGQHVFPRALDVYLHEESKLMGRGEFAARGYEFGDLWKLEVDFQGVAMLRPNRIFLGERNLRVVYWGYIDQDAAGRAGKVRLQHVFTGAGAKRSNVGAGDYRDTGPGLSALLSTSGMQRTEDLYLVERGGEEDEVFGVWRLDEFGMSLGHFQVRVPGVPAPDVESMSWHDERFLVVRGHDRGALAPFADPGRRRATTLEPSTPAPEVEGAGEGGPGIWRGLAHAPDGTVYLISDGDPAILAWRTP